MPRLLSSALTFEKNRLDSDHVFSMCLQVDITGAGAPYRLVNYDQDIVFHGLLFSRFPFDCDALEDATSMSLVRLRLTIGNVDQAFQSLLETYWLPDAPWNITLWYPVDMQQPDEMPFAAGEEFSIVQVTTDLLSATVDVQAAGLTLSGTIPKRRYTALSGFGTIPRRLG